MFQLFSQLLIFETKTATPPLGGNNSMHDDSRLLDSFDLKRLTESHTLTYDLENGWSLPFPDVDSQKTLLVVFAAHDYKENLSPIDELVAAYPNSVIVGCSTCATIADGKLSEGSISVGIMKFKNTELHLVSHPIESLEESYSVGLAIGNELSDVNLKGVLLFSDAMSTEATELVRGLQTTLLPGVAIAGGMACDYTYESTWVLSEGKPKSFHACAVGVIGERVEFARATGGGWRLIGAERQATRTNGKTLYELNGQRASDIYKKHIGPEAVSQLPDSAIRFPIAVKVNGLEMQIVRDVIRIDDETGSIQLAGDIPEGVMVQFMTTTYDEILDGVDEAVMRLRNQTIIPRENALCICISCDGRKTVLSDDTYEEAAMAFEEVGAGVNQVGMYSMGEISTSSDGAPQVHNHTITMVLIREY